jgi:hypothetical protein
MSKVFDRAMFKAESKPLKADSGIMQGFDDEGEIPEDEMMEEVSQRKPNSPEILMNNLRGDMRSVDARYQELADMVGEDAAMETPPEVLALLQAQLAQQPMGIGALPPGQGMSPPQMPTGAPPMPTPDTMGGMSPEMGGMPQPGAMPQGPEAQMPQGFAGGGIASLGNFSEGVAQAGRNGDTVLAHMTPEQHQYLTELGGGATVNPQTGLPEHFMGMQAIPQMMTNIGTRAAPYLQQANVLAGRALYNPTFTAPTISQSRTTLGTFGPKVAEGMEMYYPTFTQGIANSRVGQMVAQGADRLSKTPAAAKMGAAVMSIPGATYIADKFDNPNLSTANNNPPKIPGDPATGWTPPADEVIEGESTPINYNNLPKPPASPGAAADDTSEAAKNNQLIQGALAKKTRGERLENYMSENVPIFEKYLGGDKDYNQAQALFVLADMGLKLASTRKPGESFVSSFSRSAQGVPAGLSTIAAAEDQAKRQIKSAALTSGLQTLAAEDKAIADIQKEIIKRGVSAGEIIPTDLGGGLTSYRKKDGQPAGMRVDDTITNSFLNSKFTPQAIKDDKGVVTGFDTPYVRVSPPAQTINLDKGTRERLAGEVSRHEQALSAIDDAIKEYSGAFGPKAFFSNLKNNILVPVSPLDPNVMTEQQRTKINMAINTATKAIAKTGDTGNIAVAEQRAAADILGDKPGTFFSDPDTALKRMMTVRTSLANQRLNTASQLGWLNQDVQLDVPNLGTASDPIPQDKMTYLKNMAKTLPNGQVYVNIGGKTTPVLLSTIKD